MNFAMATLEELALETALLSDQPLDLLPPLLCKNLEGVLTGCEGTWELDSVILDKPSWVGGGQDDRGGKEVIHDDRVGLPHLPHHQQAVSEVRSQVLTCN